MRFGEVSAIYGEVGALCTGLLADAPTVAAHIGLRSQAQRVRLRYLARRARPAPAS